jgi:eukaryotic-like serine/threonine-protein kinase
MLKLLTCAQGHYWEKPIEDEADGSADNCPLCGQPAETMPLLDLAPSEVEPAAAAEPPSPPPLRDKNGRPIVAGYEILQDLGKGPTGVHLYKARQVLVNRTVVLKVVFAKEDPSQLAWGSLRNEATALGRISHPNIVQVLEAGERERQLFYNAVEHVEGPTLAEALGGKPLPLRQASALIETLARAVQQAHEKNIVHRNLKPASILLTMQNAECRMQNEKQASPPFCILHSAFCTPKITDFGLARRPVEGDASDVELQGGLPCYLAPEQAWGRTKEIGPATDIYALGAILFELIAGRPPFRAATATETLDAIQCREPPSLSGFRSGVPSDLEAICRKCLAKPPRRRYTSALDLAEDLRHYAAGLPIKARTPGKAERLGRWLRRNWRGVALVFLGLCLGATLAGLWPSGSSSPVEWDLGGRERVELGLGREQMYQMKVRRLQAQLDELQAQLEVAGKHEKLADYLRYFRLAEYAADDHDAKRGLDMLERCPWEWRGWEWHYLRGRLRNTNRVSQWATDGTITCMDISSDGRFLIVGDREEDKGTVSVWDLVKHQQLWRRQLAGPVRGLAISPECDIVALIEGRRNGGSILAAHRLPNGAPVCLDRLLNDYTPTSLAYSADARTLLVIGDDGQLRVLQASNLADLRTTRVLFSQLGLRGLRARVLPAPEPGEEQRLAAIRPDGRQLVLIPSPHSPRPSVDFTALEQAIYYGLAYDLYNSKKLAAASLDKTLLWDLRFPQRPALELLGHKGAVTGVSFHSQERLASCGADGTVCIWDINQGVLLLRLTGFNAASAVAFSHDWAARVEMDCLAIAHGNTVTVLEPR